MRANLSPAAGIALGACVLALARSATAVWVSCSGLAVARLSGTSWTRYTVANTESSPGLADGLPSNNSGAFAFTFATTTGVFEFVP